MLCLLLISLTNFVIWVEKKITEKIQRCSTLYCFVAVCVIFFFILTLSHENVKQNQIQKTHFDSVILYRMIIKPLTSLFMNSRKNTFYQSFSVPCYIENWSIDTENDQYFFYGRPNKFVSEIWTLWPSIKVDKTRTSVRNHRFIIHSKPKLARYWSYIFIISKTKLKRI